MSDTRHLATRLIALRVLKDWIGEADQQTRAELLAEAVLGDRITAAVLGPDGHIPVGGVTVTKPRAGSVTASVVDEQALLTWCREHRPEAITETVRTSDQKVILDEVKAHGGVIDRETGDVIEVRGVIVTQPTPGAPGLMVKPSEDAEAIIRAAVTEGRLLLSELAALPGPEVAG